jgi:hypothetical protein
MKDITKIPTQWLEALAKLKEAGFKAVLAGGALRDLYCGRVPKDVDIFVLHENSFGNPFKVARVVDNDGLWSTTQYNQITSHAQIDYVVRRSITDGRQPPFFELIGIIGFKSGMELIHRFDFGLNQIGIENGEIIYTDAFMKDWKHGTFTLMHAFTYDRSIKRYKAWAAGKYSGWSMEKSGIVHLHEYYKSFERPGAPITAKYPLEPA